VDSQALKYRADYAVPDAPALLLLEIDENDLVRPSTVRELSVVVSGFTGAGGLQLPKAAAVEFSPGLLFFGRRLTLQGYRRSAPFYRLRVSVATRRSEEDGPQTALAFGLRTSIIDGADLKTSDGFQKAASRILLRAAEIDAAAEESAAELGGIHAPVVYTPAQQQELDGLLEQFRRLAEAVADTAWNKRVLDVAVGIRADADSNGTDLTAQQYAAWLTYGGGVSNWGQLILGVKVASDRDSTSGAFAMRASAAARFYGGTNRHKVYVDAQAAKRAEEKTDVMVSGGAELRVASGLWATLSVATEWDGNGPDGRLRARFAFKSGFPMK
jgi:hypothetical protein